MLRKRRSLHICRLSLQKRRGWVSLEFLRFRVAAAVTRGECQTRMPDRENARRPENARRSGVLDWFSSSRMPDGLAFFRLAFFSRLAFFAGVDTWELNKDPSAFFVDLNYFVTLHRPLRKVRRSQPGEKDGARFATVAPVARCARRSEPGGVKGLTAKQQAKYERWCAQPLQYLDGEAFPDVQQVDPDLLQDLPAAPQPLVPEQKEVPAEAAVGEVPLRAAEEQCAWDTV
ncbi:CAM53 [Symbiodinium sp. KB8]|nr:CAM53 [Symbiodinium sp. KB8]